MSDNHKQKKEMERKKERKEGEEKNATIFKHSERHKFCAMYQRMKDSFFLGTKQQSREINEQS